MNEAVEGFWLTSEIDNWAKEAVVDISTKTLCVEDTLTVTTVEDQTLYVGTAYEDVIYINAAWIDDGSEIRALQKFHPRHMWDSDAERAAYATKGSPQYVALYGQQADKSTIVVFPPPDAVYSVTVMFASIADDITLLPDTYRALVIDYVLARAYQKDKAFGAAGAAYQRYITGLTINMGSFFNRESDSNDTLKLPDFTVKGE